MTVSNAALVSNRAVRTEIDKCQLICVYCHRKKTYSESCDLAITMKIETRDEYAGLDSFTCIRCKTSQSIRQSIVCKGMRINICRQCERDRTNSRRRIASDYVNNIKSVTPCADCGEQYDPICMDFDHLPGHTKSFGINKACSRGYSIVKLQEEIKKCEVVCAGCHIIRTKLRLREA